jgi:ribosomal protein RSM22 (predicted rRNA methylase)
MFDWQAEAEIRASRYGGERMRAAVEALSESYRAGKTTLAPRLDEELLVAAYLAVRFPATHAANLAVGRWVGEAVAWRSELDSFAPESLLDLGAGCGAASLALLSVWESIEVVTAVEQIPGMVRMGKEILPDAIWRTARFEDAKEWPQHDVVVSSYAVGEGRGDSSFVEKAWAAAGQLLILVEPGTMSGFAGIREAREKLVGLGARIVAPCSSGAACPMGDEDWCHFAARLNRSALHRRLKGGALGHEDEKFSYVAAWRGELKPGLPRVLRHPLIQPGRIEAQVCEAPDRHKVVATKRNKAGFRRARKLGWGDVLAPLADDGAELSARDDGETEA